MNHRTTRTRDGGVVRRLALVLLLGGCTPWITSDQTEQRLDPDEDGYAYPADCNSSSAEAYPGAVEVCDGIDNDCDGTVDGADAVDAVDWFFDSDGDGWGSGSAERQCDPPSEDHVDRGGDCEDGLDSVHPEVAEVCNDLLDNDCDGGANDCVWTGTYTVESDALLGIGTVATDNYGSALAVADLDIDGTVDLLVGAVDYSIAGGVGVFYGPVETALGLADAAARVSTGSGNAEAFGHSIANVGNLDGARRDVVVIGHPGAGSDGNGGFTLLRNGGGMAGEVYAGFWPHSNGSPQDRLGTAVSGLNDVDGDGDDELLVTAPGSDVNHLDGGVVRMFHGPASSIAPTGAAAQITGPAGCGLGDALATGDFDGDGVQDVVIGSAACDISGVPVGAVHIVSGSVTGLQAVGDAAFAMIEGTVVDQLFGTALAVGDADGDGNDDLWVASPGAPSAVSPADRVGSVSLFLGPLSGQALSSQADVIIYGIQGFEGFGRSIMTVPDLTGDGIDELVIGAPEHSESSFRAIAPSGGAYLFYGPFADATRDDADAVFLGRFGTFGFGAAMLAEDLDDDGVSELVIGGPPPNWDDHGAVSVFWGVGL
ncbi:MAG: putative metal-binding motif-containing protein [Proteobacteria bacterium]|nr:putative metal-binding motif-containing protein [Pseudomonadota bacterium]